LTLQLLFPSSHLHHVACLYVTQHDLKASCTRDREDHDALHQQTRKLLEKKELTTPVAAVAAPFGSPLGSPDGSPLPSARVEDNVDGDLKKRTDRMASGPIRLKKNDSHPAAGNGNGNGGSKTPRIAEEAPREGKHSKSDDEFDHGDDIDYDEDDEKPHHPGGHHHGGGHGVPPPAITSMTHVPPSTSLPAVPLPVTRRNISSDPDPPSVPSSSSTVPLSTSPSSSTVPPSNASGIRSPIVSPRGLNQAPPINTSGIANVLPATISGSTPRQHIHSLTERMSQAANDLSAYHSREPSRVVSDSNGLSSTGIISESGGESRHGSPRSRTQSRVDSNGNNVQPATTTTEHKGAKKAKGQSNSVNNIFIIDVVVVLFLLTELSVS
jgi:hypothetical protein